jgi:hypothetical protein
VRSEPARNALSDCENERERRFGVEHVPGDLRAPTALKRETPAVPGVARPWVAPPRQPAYVQLVDPEGRVLWARPMAEMTAESEVWQRNAIWALEQWRYEPTLVAGKAVSRCLVMYPEFRFTS